MSKKIQYEDLLSQLYGLWEGEPDIIANCSNTVALIHRTFNFWWTGFYFVQNEELVLGPFQGPVACTRIPYGRGVCGTSWESMKTIVVPDVHKFPGHIACSETSCSEIVIPVIRNSKVVAVLDIDSDKYDTFDGIDASYLEKICANLPV
jgi:GAF domain-containing protein